MMVSIDRAGRVVIPKEVRESLGLGAGTELELEVHGDAIQIARRRSPVRTLEWVDGRPVFPAVAGHVMTDADVQDLRDADRR